MCNISSSKIEENTRNKLKEKLLQGKGQEVEEEIFSLMKSEAAKELQELINEVTESKEGREIVKQLRAKYQYRTVQKRVIRVITKGEQKITVTSWYGLAKQKKKGRPKKGKNGTGTHILLSFWGYIQKRSPGSINEVVRIGVGSGSYDLAEEQLRSQGVNLSSNSIDYLVQHVGAIASKSRGSMPLFPNETLEGKRVSISLDGGRIRSRQIKTGRPKKEQKQAGFTTAWREPKLLVISEMDENGKKKKGTKPVYEATMGNPQEVLLLLIALCQQLQLNLAREIVCISDGAAWIWNLFEKLIKQFNIKEKTIEIVDFFHATEHITELTEAHTKKTEKEQRQWANILQKLLREGKFNQFKESILTEAKIHTLPEITRHFNYFQTHEHRMRYAQYEAALLPIGSGIVESAIKRVINHRLKSPGTFWKIEKVERMLQLRCALMAGRWNIFMNNFLQETSLALSI